MRKWVELLLKPASGNCDLRCRYCFYRDEQDNREIRSYGIMTQEVLAAILQKAFALAEEEVSLNFQGGEPTLAGLDFYRTLIRLEQQYNTRNIPVHHSIQTNGFSLDEEWVRFFARHKFFVGVSLDGTEAIHNRCRPTLSGGPTFERVMKSIRLLQAHQVDFNILTVVTRQAAHSAREIYQFYRENHLLYQQYIPCLDPLTPCGPEEFSLTWEDYACFLKDLFDCWYGDISAGRFIYNRYFENLVGMLKGYPPQMCGINGCCTPQYVVEADGSVYPCDFYVLDEYRLGSLVTDTFEQLDQRRAQLRFLESSRTLCPECRACPWVRLCYAGCRRERLPLEQGLYGKNRFCRAYQEFFSYAGQRLASFL